MLLNGCAGGGATGSCKLCRARTAVKLGGLSMPPRLVPPARHRPLAGAHTARALLGIVSGRRPAGKSGTNPGFQAFKALLLPRSRAEAAVHAGQKAPRCTHWRARGRGASLDCLSAPLTSCGLALLLAAHAKPRRMLPALPKGNRDCDPEGCRRHKPRHERSCAGRLAEEARCIGCRRAEGDDRPGSVAAGCPGRSSAGGCCGRASPRPGRATCS